MIEAKSCGTVCEDRISELPEDLLVRILDLVPTKEAVATMSLSKRWQSIWTMKRTLDYKDGSDDDHEEQGKKSKKSVWRFLDKSLQLHKAPVIESLCIELGPQCPTDVDIGKWVTSAVDRRVRVLKFKLLWSADPIRLPESLYTCKTLVQLTLSHNILVDFPSSSGCLQSLRFLDLLFVVYKDEDSLISFLSSCPILETMVVRRKKDDNIKRFTVKVPSLWFLFYDNENFNDVGDTDRCLVIDTPALEKFGIVDVSGDDCSFDRMMPCLDCAYLDTTKSYPDDNILLKSISSVLSLKLSSSQLVCCSAIYFSRLTKLIIVPERSDWMENLMALLRNSPKVKNLVVDCVSTIFLAPLLLLFMEIKLKLVNVFNIMYTQSFLSS